MPTLTNQPHDNRPGRHRALVRPWGALREVFLLLAAFAIGTTAGCRQPQPAPPAETPEPQVESLQPPPQEAPLAETQPAPEPATQPAERLRRFNISSLGLKADQPLSILAKVDADQPARIAASLQNDHYLVIDTSNVESLQLDLLNLPRRQAGRLVLRVDGQGLEITGRGNKIIYLRRNPAGAWSFAPKPPIGPR